jgi:hypothetical protein
MQTLFFAGLCVIFLSFFFTFFKSKTNRDESMSPQVTLTGFQATLGLSPTVTFPYTGDREKMSRYERRQMDEQTNSFLTPRVIGVYFLMTLLLTAWGIAAWLANGHNGRYSRPATAWPLLAVLILMFLTITLDMGHLKQAMGRYDRTRLWDVLGMGIGFWLYFIGLILTFVGAFIQHPAPLYTPGPAYRPVVEPPAVTNE